MWPKLPPLKRLLVKTGRAAFTTTQWLCAWHLFTEHIGGVRVVSGPSMLPTMNNTDDLVLEDCLARRRRIARGDLVTLLSPVEPGRTVCKRVLGLPGDTVCVDPARAPQRAAHVVVPAGHIWVAGDNTAASRDSRTYGPVPIALVRGRILARLYPDPRWFTNPIVYID